MKSGFFAGPVWRRQLTAMMADVGGCILAIGLAWTVRWGLISPRPFSEGPAWRAWLVLIAVQLMALVVADLYSEEREFRTGRDVGLILIVVAAAVALVSVGFFFATGRPTIGRGVLLLYVPISASMLTLIHALLAKHFRRGGRVHRVVVVGADPATARLRSALSATRIRDYEIVGELTELSRLSSKSLGRALEKINPDLVVYSLVSTFPAELFSALEDLRVHGIEVLDLPSFAARSLGWIPCESIDERWVLNALDLWEASTISDNIRRTLQAVAASTLLVAFSPVMLLVCVLIKLESSGPIFFPQDRLGGQIKAFRLFKFRTMVTDAEKVTGPLWAVAGDPRVTKAGALLRRTGLDELPQLVNIVRGEMSFIGVRPIRAFFAEQLARSIPHYWTRFRLPPSVTGWAQIRHDYAGSVEGQRRKFEYELFYLRYRSFAVDLYILLKTAQKLVLGRVGVTPEEPISAPSLVRALPPVA